MSLFAADAVDVSARSIEVVEPSLEDCTATPAPEGHVKLRNYRLVGDGIRAYTPTGDVHTSPIKGKVVSRWDVCSTVSPPRAKILGLVRPEQPGSAELEDIVRPASRRGLVRPLDEDARRFLQRALLSPSPRGASAAPTPEPEIRRGSGESDEPDRTTEPRERSLADELREAEERAELGDRASRKSFEGNSRRGGGGGVVHEAGAGERDRLGRLALSVESDEADAGGPSDTGDDGCRELSAAARRLDALLAESRDLHEELAEIHEDIQAEEERAGRCAAAARALGEQSRSLRFLDDVLALLRGDLAGAVRARAWPFAIGRRIPGRSYII